MLSLLFAALAFANPIDESVRDALKWENTTLASDASDYALAASVISGFAITASSGERRWEKTGAVAGAYVANFALNYAVKKTVSRERPGKQDRLSFFSGHTSTAFLGAGAACLQKEHCAAMLALAGAIGYLRIAGNWHWFSDVAVGAGVGYSFGRFVPTIVVVF